MSRARPFRATYRLQLNASFDFAAARELIPYLRDLGVSHLYLSPSLQARPESTHGYDVIDPTCVSMELGGERGLRALAELAHAAQLGLVLDLVPNHMAIDRRNHFWNDPALREQFFDLDPETGAHRRFFDIDDLAGVRQEDLEVFEITHELVLRLVREGVIDALRIDHPDGLADPVRYFERLRDGGAEVVWVEKILEGGERLRDWPVTGTVGYEFCNDVCALFVDVDAERAFTVLWREICGERRRFEAVALQAKLEQARVTFAPEVDRLARMQEVPGGAEALARAVGSLPIYRTYVNERERLVTKDDRDAIATAEMPPELEQMLVLERASAPGFVTRFQQTTPAVMAKGVEDTAFYRYARLVALCEVGGDPNRFGISSGLFHARNADRARRFPDGLLTTTTHDTKRSADVRARIAALTWLPGEWETHVRRWIELTESLRSGAGAPDPIERYFLFQTLVGAWPIELERMQSYLEKALREAKRNSNWINPNRGWERGVLDFCRALYSFTPFLEDFEPFVERVAPLGDRIALGMVVLKLTSPGVPDIYQGDELWFRALVDPDNRRPVDWEWHQAMQARLQGGAPVDHETIKLWLTRALLTLRIRRPEAFAGSYQPLEAGERCVAFSRGDQVLVAVAARPDTGGAELHGGEGQWRDVLRGELYTLGARESVARLLDEHGIAVLERH